MITRLTGAVLFVLACGLAALGAPMLEADSEVYEFGSILEGLSIEHTFVLTNVGDETLVIHQVRATCGCTTTELATDELAPGESVGLTMIVSTAGGNGSFSKYVYVYSNDPRYSAASGDGGQRFTLFVRGTVLRAEPHNISTEDVHYYYVPLIDVRPYADYAAGHLVGAVNIPAEMLLAQADTLPVNNLLVLYDKDESVTRGLIEDLIGEGLPLARYLDGGLASWYSQYGREYIVPAQSANTYGAPAGSSSKAGMFARASDIYRGYRILIDLRTPAEYEAGHLFGAINLPATTFTVAALQGLLSTSPMTTEIILYDATGRDSDALAQSLIMGGYVNAKSLLGGFAEWTRAYGDDLIWSGTE